MLLGELPPQRYHDRIPFPLYTKDIGNAILHQLLADEHFKKGVLFPRTKISEIENGWGTGV